MARIYVREWTVIWRGAFPLDMLRYDNCWPKTEKDSASITRSLETANNYEWTARLQAIKDHKQYGPPTTDRWASFSCRVSDVTVT